MYCTYLEMANVFNSSKVENLINCSTIARIFPSNFVIGGDLHDVPLYFLRFDLGVSLPLLLDFSKSSTVDFNFTLE